MRGDPGKDSRRNGTGDGCLMFARQALPDLVDRGHLPARHLAHDGVHFERRGDHKSAGPPAFALPFIDRANRWKTLRVEQLFPPRAFLLRHNGLMDCLFQPRFRVWVRAHAATPPSERARISRIFCHENSSVQLFIWAYLFMSDSAEMK